VGFEPTIPALERAKTVHTSDRTATGIGGTARKTSKTDSEAFAIFCKELYKYRDVCDGSSGDSFYFK
jgi:hypothetical protein